jgi:hypothetical protein
MMSVPPLSSIEQDDKIWIRKDVYDALNRQKNFWRRVAGGLAEYVRVNIDELPEETALKQQAIYFVNEFDKLKKLYDE